MQDVMIFCMCLEWLHRGMDGVLGISLFIYLCFSCFAKHRDLECTVFDTRYCYDNIDILSTS